MSQRKPSRSQPENAQEPQLPLALSSKRRGVEPEQVAKRAIDRRARPSEEILAKWAERPTTSVQLRRRPHLPNILA